MKYNIKDNGIFLIALLFVSSFISCNKHNFLKEVPHSFLSPDNAFLNKEGFDAAIADLYRLARGLRTAELMPGEGDKTITALYGSGTDLGWYWDKKLNFGNYELINPTNNLANGLWNVTFKIINGSNVVLSRLQDSPLADDQKQSIEAEAKWFRAYAYRFLVYLFGDVPKLTSEIEAPKFDFARTPKKEILNFMIADLTFASQHLPGKNPGDGHLSKATADHLLAETYISLEKYDSAIIAASNVINDGQYKLMTHRFGNFTDRPGDLFSDLFRLGNQNTSSGNTGSILVWQMEYGVPGGEANYSFERAWGPFLEKLVDSEGKRAILPSDTIGRPVGFFKPSPYLASIIWQNDSGDIRNSKYNMQRKFYNNNPDSKEFGEVIRPRSIDTVRSYYVWVKKASMPYGHPQGYDSQGHIYTGIYAIRLAETYLLRAEAYLDKGDKIKAVADINVVRSRAHASPVTPEDIDINYILDERARELVGEEPRRLTLARLGLLYKRVKKYNSVSASTVQPYNNLLPIPQNTIDANSGADFPQNPGY